MDTRVVALDPSMIDGLMALSTAAHWNQGDADWRYLLAHGQGWGVFAGVDGRERLVASTVVLPYGGRFAWVSMVLVAPACRGRGLARRLLEVALETLARQGLTPVLDATPAGQPVYLKQGFVGTWGFARWRRPGGRWLPTAEPAAAAAVAPAIASGAAARPLVTVDEPGWAALDTLDAAAFGASRIGLLRDLARRLPAAAWVVHRPGGPAGFLLGRDGRTAVQLGPLVTAGSAGDEADDRARDRSPDRAGDGPGGELVARPLLEAAIGALAREAGGTLPTLIVDLRDGQSRLRDWLQARGFAFERPFTRMVRGTAAAPGDARRVVLVAGPELG